MEHGSSIELSVDEVHFQYGSQRVLDGVSLAFGSGVTALVGANGAGKTTLIKIAAGILPPRRGRVRYRVDGRDVTRNRGRYIGFVPQSPPATAFLDARSYVEYFAFLRGVPRKGLPGAAMAALATVGLEDRARTRTSKLSGGMFRRLCWAAAIVGEPPVLILDEPTTGLDPVQRVEACKLVKTLATGRIVVLATHLVEDVAALAGRMVVIDHGRVLYDGSPGGLAHDTRGDDSTSGGELVTAVRALLVRRGPVEVSGDS